MNRYLSTILLISILSTPSFAEDIVNGWSGNTKIVKIHSEGSRTLLRLLDQNGASCGHPDMWSLPLDETARSAVKHTLVTTAFAANKTINLRCENSRVSDFEVLQ